MLSQNGRLLCVNTGWGMVWVMMVDGGFSRSQMQLAHTGRILATTTTLLFKNFTTRTCRLHPHYRCININLYGYKR